MTNTNGNVRKLTESAIMLGLAVVLSLFAVFKLPNGGSVTIASMLPILFISFKYSTKWGLLVSVTYSLLQMFLNFWAPPTPDFLSFLLVIMLDYVLAFGVIGFGGVIYRALGNKMKTQLKMAIACLVCFFGRFVCHYLSGLIVWGSADDRPAWLYSLIYNGSYMAAEIIITTVIIFIIGPVMKKYLITPKTAN